MKNSKKTLIIAFILIAMVATMAIGFVGCGGTNLDGVYKENSNSTAVIKISGNTIQYIDAYGTDSEKVFKETTFTLNKNVLSLEQNIGSFFSIVNNDKNKLACMGIAVNGQEQTIIYTKVTDKK